MGDNVGDDDGKQDAPHLTNLHYRALPCPALPCYACLLAFLLREIMHFSLASEP